MQDVRLPERGLGRDQPSSRNAGLACRGWAAWMILDAIAYVGRKRALLYALPRSRHLYSYFQDTTAARGKQFIGTLNLLEGEYLRE